MFVILTVVMNILCVGVALEPGCRPWVDGPVEKIVPFRNTCYVIFDESFKLNWDKAKTYCGDRGGILAKVLNLNETDKYLFNALLPYGNFWIGVSRQKTENGSGYELVYTDGAEVEFIQPPSDRFRINRDSNITHVMFIAVFRERRSLWYDRNWTDHERRILCEYNTSIFPNTALTTRKRIQRRKRSGEIRRYQLFKVVRTDAYILPMENILRRPYSSFQCCSACLRIADCVAVNYAAIGKKCRLFKNISVLKNKDNAEFREGWTIWAGLEGAELLHH